MDLSWLNKDNLPSVLEKVLSLDMKKFNVFSNSKNMRSLLKTMLELQSKITYLNHHLYFKKVTDKEKGFK